MKYVLATEQTVEGQLHYHGFTNMLSSTPILHGTPILSEAYIYDTEQEAKETLEGDEWRLLPNGYYVRSVTEKELFTARLSNT